MCLGIPGRIETIDDEAETTRSGTVRFGGVRRAINLSLTPEAGVGDYVIVHAGFALNRIDEDEAQRVFELIEEIEGLDELSVDPLARGAAGGAAERATDGAGGGGDEVPG